MKNKKKTQSVDWEPFLAGISSGKTVIEYGANRTVFWQGEPADSVFYLRRGKVKLSVTSQKARKRSSPFWAKVISSARDAWQASRCASPRLPP